MTSPIDSIPVLTPVPLHRSKPPSPAPAASVQGSAETTHEAEAIIDKFSTLFAPPTPRASPTLEQSSTVIDLTRPHLHDRRDSDSEFGSFVSVPASEDPLSLLSSFSTPILAAPSETSLPNSHPHPTHGNGHSKNTSMSFFDKFGKDAKLASDRNRRGLLDELLQHEDDPLYWLKEESSSNAPDNRPGHGPPGLSVPGDGDQEEGNGALSDSLSDLDFDFFNKPSSSTPTPIAVSSTHTPAITRQPSRNSTNPSQSPTRSTPPTLAPPLASTSAASFTSTPPTATHPLETPTTRSPPQPIRSPSYQTLSNISARWMSSLLPSTRASPPETSSQSPTAHDTLENLFAPHASTTAPRLRTSNTSPLPIHRETTPTPSSSAAHLQPHHAATLSSSFSQPVQISHGTPFGPPAQSSSHVSPFAAHAYVPPSGAPGFKGDQYDWDKGYSTELERELTEGQIRTESPAESELVDVSTAGSLRGQAGPGERSTDPVHPVGLGISATAREAPPVGIANLMEKKSGSVELKGRKEMTVGVLDGVLADLIRPNLPALFRLPRSWSLLYSLDQHGISLNTLYTRCEAPLQARPGMASRAGALVVMKDSGDAVFGAWMGQGLHQSKGKGYYGSGESFLWKYVGGRLQVFKWTGRNEYVALCEPEYLSFGGGDGQYGLYLDDTLLDGSSARCPTFNNDPLCSKGPKKGGAVTFECVGLEVWGVGS